MSGSHLSRFSYFHLTCLSWDAYVYRPYDADAPLTVPANKGREAMVYLTYIIDSWQILPSNILFHHGSRTSWHQAVDILTLLRDLRLEAVEEIGYVSLRCTWRSGCPNEIRPLDRDTGSDDGSRQAIEDWMPQVWSELFPNVTVPATIASQCCAQFVVSRRAVQRRSLEDYKRWREWLITTEMPDDFSGRMFEKVWAYIFGMEPVQLVVHPFQTSWPNRCSCPDPEFCACHYFGKCGADSAPLLAADILE